MTKYNDLVNCKFLLVELANSEKHEEIEHALLVAIHCMDLVIKFYKVIGNLDGELND